MTTTRETITTALTALTGVRTALHMPVVELSEVYRNRYTFTVRGMVERADLNPEQALRYITELLTNTLTVSDAERVLYRGRYLGVGAALAGRS
jgi:hypothetical protein